MLLLLLLHKHSLGSENQRQPRNEDHVGAEGKDHVIRRHTHDALVPRMSVLDKRAKDKSIQRDFLLWQAMQFIIDFETALRY